MAKAVADGGVVGGVEGGDGAGGDGEGSERPLAQPPLPDDCFLVSASPKVTRVAGTSEAVQPLHSCPYMCTILAYPLPT